MAQCHDGQIIETERLILEPFSPSHAETLNAMNADPEIMRYIGGRSVETLEETKAAIARVDARWKNLGYSWWAILHRKEKEIIGAACVQNLANNEGAPLEIGWRLKSEFQGQGFATEAGQAAIDFAFEHLGVDYLVAVAHPDNKASHRVMERLGMTYVGIEEHYDAPCVVYALHETAVKT
ncbi:GNAT family N-acetyltransferase [Pelagibius sp. Alg239-R121]|uniref:GNAT family N-acetyltransferase n=1 Tax=Pelagibius sp. Alg239-R121 TaxID=2993448 RepID=UPI0024A700F7|nr:GNAT family N-acetyltransferase [Pelagibius sp. Alg239-R121]